MFEIAFISLKCVWYMPSPIPLSSTVVWFYSEPAWMEWDQLWSIIEVRFYRYRILPLFSLHQNDRTCQNFIVCTLYNVLKDPCHILDLIKNVPLIFEIQLTVFEIWSFALLALLGSLFTRKLVFEMWKTSRNIPFLVKMKGQPSSYNQWLRRYDIKAYFLSLFALKWRFKPFCCFFGYE